VVVEVGEVCVVRVVLVVRGIRMSYVCVRDVVMSGIAIVSVEHVPVSLIAVVKVIRVGVGMDGALVVVNVVRMVAVSICVGIC